MSERAFWEKFRLRLGTGRRIGLIGTVVLNPNYIIIWGAWKYVSAQAPAENEWINVRKRGRVSSWWGLGMIIFKWPLPRWLWCTVRFGNQWIRASHLWRRLVRWNSINVGLGKKNTEDFKFLEVLNCSLQALGRDSLKTFQKSNNIRLTE